MVSAIAKSLLWLAASMSIGAGCFRSVSIGAGDGGPDGESPVPCTASLCPDLPDRPPSSTEGASGAPVFFALRNPRFDLSAPLPPSDARCAGQSECRLGDVVGFDLDGHTTTEESPRSECVPPRLDAEPPEDGVAGIDDYVGASFMSNLTLVLPTFEHAIQVAHARGEGTLLVRVSEWNGTKDDPDVTIALIQAMDAATTGGPFAWGAPTGACPPSSPVLLDASGCPATDPLFDETTQWWARSDGFIGSDVNRPLLVDHDAYVDDGVVVMRLPDGGCLHFADETRGFDVRWTDGRAVFFLSPTLDEVVSATLGGRWKVSDVLDVTEGLGVCEGIREILDGVLTVHADVLSVPPTSDTSGAFCDAVSTAILFDGGTRGVFAGIAPVAPPPIPDLCP